MKIILKPFGVVVLGVAVLTLGILALRQPQSNATVIPTPQKALSVVAPSPESIVYDNALKNDWANFSWGKNEFSDNKKVTSGSCIRVESGAFEALYFHHEPMSVASYDRLTFRINGGDKGGQTLKLVAQMDDKGKNKGGGDIMLPPLRPGTWTTITKTTKELGIEGKTNVVGFWIQEGVGDKAMPAYYVDDVRFLRPGEPVPAE